MVLAKPVKDDDDDEVELEGYGISSVLWDMIKDVRSEHPRNFKIVNE